MGAGDSHRLLRFHATLSSETAYLRFFSVHGELSAEEVFLFTHVDHRTREAIVAVVGGEIVGVARFDRLAAGDDAEVAFVVTDEWQGRGLGTALFEGLADRARQIGVTRFIAETLPHNRRMLAVFRTRGLPVTTCLREGTVNVAIQLCPPNGFAS